MALSGNATAWGMENFSESEEGLDFLPLEKLQNVMVTKRDKALIDYENMIKKENPKFTEAEIQSLIELTIEPINQSFKRINEKIQFKDPISKVDYYKYLGKFNKSFPIIDDISNYKKMNTEESIKTLKAAGPEERKGPEDDDDYNPLLDGDI